MFGYWLKIVWKITLGQLVNENIEKLAGLTFLKFLDLIEVIFMTIYTVLAFI